MPHCCLTTHWHEGLSPRVMGIGPAFAIPAVLKKAGITKDDVDLFEVEGLLSVLLMYLLTRIARSMKHSLPCTSIAFVNSDWISRRSTFMAVLLLWDIR